MSCRRRIGLGAAAMIVVLAVGGCGGASRASTPTTTSPATAGPVGFTANGQQVYGNLGPEGIPLETGPSLGPVSPAVTGQPVDGVSCNSTEQLAYHHHIHLIVFVDGRPRSVPLAIGIMPQVGIEQTPEGPFVASSTTCFYWLHVHAVDGIIHIESPAATTFMLGQAFAIWGQPLSSSAVGPDQGPVTATVNGAPYVGDPADIPLNERDQIVLNVGGPVVNPPPIDWSSTQL